MASSACRNGACASSCESCSGSALTKAEVFSLGASTDAFLPERGFHLGAGLKFVHFVPGGRNHLSSVVMPREVVYNPTTGGSAGLGAPEPGGEDETSYKGMTLSEIADMLDSPMGVFVGGYPTDLFEPPDESVWGLLDDEPGRCAKTMYGSVNECPPPEDETIRSTTHLQTLDTDSWRPAIDFDSEWSGDETEFLLTAWALVNENLDLIQYATCWVYGTGNILELGWRAVVLRQYVRIGNPLNCMVKNFSGVSLSGSAEGAFNIERKDCEGADYAAYVIPPLANTIWICTDAGTSKRSSYFRDNLFNAWQGGGVDALCAAVGMATLLVHEMVHVCGFNLNDWVEERDGHTRCDGAHMVGYIFQWAMMRRYAGSGGNGAADSDCCSGLDRDEQFGSADYAWDVEEGCGIVASSTMVNPDVVEERVEKSSDRMLDRLHGPPRSHV
jgi:hypothetical protein